MKRTVRLTAASAALCFAVLPLFAAEVDRSALYRHLKKVFSAPPGVEFELKDVKPSSIPGFETGTMEIRFQGRVQSQPIQMSRDGRYYVMSDAFALGPSKIAGLLSTAGNDASAPQIHASKDMGHFLVGEIHDLTVDPDAANLAKINLKGVPSRGPANAPLILVEYSDLECPYCSKAHIALDQQLIKTYGSNIHWVFKNFPLTSIHPWAYNAAIAAACAQRMKPAAFWKIGGDFLEHQGEIKPDNIREKALASAKAAGLDSAKFEACYDKQETKAAIEADIEEAKTLGVDSTPTFYVNGRKAGFRDFTAFKAILDDMLAEKTAKN